MGLHTSFPGRMLFHQFFFVFLLSCMKTLEIFYTNFTGCWTSILMWTNIWVFPHLLPFLRHNETKTCKTSAKQRITGDNYKKLYFDHWVWYATSIGWLKYTIYWNDSFKNVMTDSIWLGFEFIRTFYQVDLEHLSWRW